MPKGMLSDEFGFRPETCRWVIGGIDFPLTKIDFLPQPYPANVEVRYAGEHEISAICSSEARSMR
jgi:hypothetical protein